MDELTIGDKIYISSKRAAKITGYAKDYVGQLCREGRVEARLVGRNWYVLESSIKEHRFGEVEKDPKESRGDISNNTAKNLPEPEISWSAPRYEAELPEFVPPLLQKTEPVVSRKVVSDMQSAWQEWFTAQKSPVEALPDGSQEFNGSSLPALVTEPVEEQEEVVHITRMETESPHLHVEEESSFDVTLHKIEEQPRAPAVSRSLDSVERREGTVVDMKGRQGRSTSLVLKSVFLGVAMLSAVIALVGTGVLADVLKESGKSESQNSVLQFLGGQSEFSNM